jgi:uncharacterized protein (TIGR03083 family)
MTVDAAGLQREEQDRLLALGRSLNAEQWAHESLCDGWKVRDVYAHMAIGYSYPMPKVVAYITRYGGSVAKASFHLSRKVGAETSQQELLDQFDHARAHPRGIAKRLPASAAFSDHAVHELDIRRPLGIDGPAFRPDALGAAIDLLSHGKGPGFDPAGNAAGLGFVATDIGWSHTHGDDPVVEGPAEQLLLAIAGRPAGLEGLSGSGLDALRARIRIELFGRCALL